MSLKQVHFGNEAKLALRAGVDTLADAVKSTFGPGGRHVMLGRDTQAPRCTLDGISVARAIKLTDPVSTAAADILRQAAQATADDVGDGTTTATVLAQALVREGLKHLAVGVDATRLRRGIEQAAAQADRAISELAAPCTEPEMLRMLGTLAAHGDEQLGHLVADALHSVGCDGFVQIEASRSQGCSLHMTEGLRLDAGWASPGFVNDAERSVTLLEWPLVLVALGRLDDPRELAGLMEHAAEAGRALVVVAEDLAPAVLELLVTNTRLRTIRANALKAPGTGDRRRAMMEDLAFALGTSVFDPLTGRTLSTLAISELGSCARVESDARSTMFLDGRTNAQTLGTHVAQLRQRARDTPDAKDGEQLLERAARLARTVAVLRIGAATDTEYQDKADRAEDALRTVRSAMRQGIVPGGGVAYLRARQALLASSVSAQDDEPNFMAGRRALENALRAPFIQIVGNTGEEALPLLAYVDGMDVWQGYDAKNRVFGDLKAMGVVDAAVVARSALRHAVSAAVSLLSAECVVTHA